jgi:hypothetical protein
VALPIWLLEQQCFEQAFEETRHASVLASIPADHLSPSLMTSMRMAGNHARNHPSVLIPAICKALEKEHLPIFKRQGKLYTGPARPNPLPKDATLAERPGILVEWIRSNAPAKLEGLWKAVLPEGGTAPPAEFAADLFWLLQQGHILLFTDDTLVVQELRELAPSAPSGGSVSSKTKDKKRKKEGVTVESQVPVGALAATSSAVTVSEQADTAEQDERVDVVATSEDLESQAAPIDKSAPALAEIPATEAPTASDDLTVSESSEPPQEAEPNTSTSM